MNGTLEESNFKNIQANILIGHGREHVYLLFIRFDKLADPEKIKSWVRGFAKNEISSTQTLLDELKTQGERAKNPNIIKNFLLTRNGSAIIGYPADKFPQDPSFKKGSRNASIRERLGDPAVSKWEPGFREEIDAVVLLAGNSLDNLKKYYKYIKPDIEKIGNVFLQEGKKLYYEFEPGKKVEIEPFGFRDGISNPKFFKRKKEGDKKIGDPLLVGDNWKLVLDEHLGSYMVFRKLEQNVKKFNEKALEIANKLGTSADVIKSQIVGRWKGGRPLIFLNDSNSVEMFDNYDLNVPNEGNYGLDKIGAYCPFHAHIRKTNPRDPDIQISKGKPPIFIVRRGIPYDDRPNDEKSDEEPEKGVGLLFMSYQVSIRKQFEHIQQWWCNNPRHPKVYTGDPIRDNKKGTPDPLVGKGKPAREALLSWARLHGERGDNDYSFESQITLVGSEFFYAAPINILENL